MSSDEKPDIETKIGKYIQYDDYLRGNLPRVKEKKVLEAELVEYLENNKKHFIYVDGIRLEKVEQKRKASISTDMICKAVQATLINEKIFGNSKECKEFLKKMLITLEKNRTIQTVQKLRRIDEKKA